MPDNRENLINKISDIVSDFWEQHKRPLLLSGLPNDLISSGIADYKDIADGNLKKFIELSTEDGNYKLIEHPLQKAKIGVIPKERNFKYEDVAYKKSSTKRSSTHSVSEESTVAVSFLRSLSKLSDEELDSIVIPTKVLVKLFRKQ